MFNFYHLFQTVHSSLLLALGIEKKRLTPSYFMLGHCKVKLTTAGHFHHSLHHDVTVPSMQYQNSGTLCSEAKFLSLVVTVVEVQILTPLFWTVHLT